MRPRYPYHPRRKDQNLSIKQDKNVENTAYIGLVDARELFEHVQKLNKKIKDQEKVFEQRIQEVREAYKRQLEQHKRMMERKLINHHEKTRTNFRRYQEFQDDWLNQYKNSQKDLWNLTQSQQRELMSLTDSYTSNQGVKFVPKSYSYGVIEARIFLSEFEFFVKVNKLPQVPSILIQFFKLFLQGQALNWIQPILKEPGKFRKFYRDFDSFLHAFRETFAQGQRY